MPDSKNQQQGAINREWGHQAEQIACEYLLAQGYVIREKNLRYRNIEIDIVAEKDNWIVFVEVKARKGEYEDPLDAVDRKKQSKMVRGADIYLSNLTLIYNYRFDIITITGTPKNYQMEHFPDAFMPPLRRRVAGKH